MQATLERSLAEQPPEAGMDDEANLVIGALEAQWRLPAAEVDRVPVSTEDVLGREKYAHSLILLRRLGEVAAAGALETIEGREVERAAREDFESSIVEMLQTDAEFRKWLEIRRARTFAIKDGRVVNNEGEPMVDMLRRGAAVSARDALKDRRMQTQANRDLADVRNAEAVDEMSVGSLRMTLAMDPKEAMARDGKGFWENLGYREGIAFLQWYYKVDEATVVGGAYSVDYSDLEKWRDTWADFGGHIPEGVATDSMLDYAITRQCATEEEAKSRLAAMKAWYYEKYGLMPPNRSVDEFKEANQEPIDDTFHSLYKPLAMAHATGTKNGEMQEIVQQLLQQPDPFKPEVVWKLSGIHGSAEFDDDATRLMENIIRYGMTERLRMGVQAFDGTKRATAPAFVDAQGVAAWQAIAGGIARGVIDGTRAGRTYGGCTPSLKLGNVLDGEEDPLDPQDIYGGKESERQNEKDPTSGKIRCIKCREYVEKKKVVKEDHWECPSCKHKVDICTGNVLVEGEPSRVRRTLKRIGAFVLGKKNKGEHQQ